MSLSMSSAHSAVNRHLANAAYHSCTPLHAQSEGWDEVECGRVGTGCLGRGGGIWAGTCMQEEACYAALLKNILD